MLGFGILDQSAQAISSFYPQKAFFPGQTKRFLSHTLWGLMLSHCAGWPEGWTQEMRDEFLA